MFSRVPKDVMTEVEFSFFGKSLIVTPKKL